MLWRLPVCLLVVALASAEPVPDIFGYLPPGEGSDPTPAVCLPAVTSVSYVNRIQTSVVVRTINQVDTQYRTTTVIQRQVVPTTNYITRVVTQAQIQTSIIQSTNVQFRDRVVDQTIPSPNIVRTQFVTSTRVVPQVSYVTREQVQTNVVPVEVTRTQFRTVEQTNINFQTQQVQRTNVVTITGRPVVQTRLQTLVQTSVVQRQQPAQTRFITSTQVQQVVNTRTVQGPNQIRTSVVNRQQVIPTTITSRRVDNRFVTNTNFVTRTNTRYQTNLQTQVVQSEVVSTRVVQNTIFSTRYTTLVQPVERVQTTTVYRTVQPNPVLVTREQISTSVLQIQGANRIVDREVVQTQQRQQIVYSTVFRPEQVTVTRTVTTSSCGYNYDAPAVPFNF